MSGLKLEIKAELRVAELPSLPAMMDYAQRIESKNLLLQQVKGGGISWGRSYSPSNPGALRTTTTMGATPRPSLSTTLHMTSVPERPPMQRSNPGTFSESFRYLTVAEIQTKREKSLCFKCDAKYTMGDVCKGN
ncbi:hypothetical protein PanWU01x14_297080 [Parasponia andersonii]|uniref:Uncharacterized protein n=1 Tax=Parasponia andersonii TaxID=3476 RepID=A0A2P5AV99_PARAD|nr:hypothetical protein PanWU01x14_297080 [Parasponia andersonii]